MSTLLVIGYALSFVLPAAALFSVYWRARQKNNEYISNKSKRAAIDAKYPRLTKLDDILQRSGDPQEELGISRSDLFQEHAELSKKKIDEYRDKGIRYLSSGRVSKDLEEIFEGKPSDAYSLATKDVWLVGVGLVLGATTSIAALFV